MQPSYQLLPLLHERLPRKTLLVNACGDHAFATNEQMERLLDHRLEPEDPFYRELKSKHFLADRNLAEVVNLLAVKLRTKKAFLRDFTSLHMMVVTLRCNHKCEYCQVSSEEEDAWKWDMAPETARRIVDFVFRSPSPTLKIEFQGGEPLLNWDTVRATIEYAEKRNHQERRHLEFVICTNLFALTDEILAFIKERNVNLSTSLDGPRELHDRQRLTRSGESSYDRCLANLEKAAAVLGRDRVSALMTTTRWNIDRLAEIVDEYVRLGFDGLFLRALNPYGWAADKAAELGYDMDVFAQAYRKTLDYILALNMRGVYFPEYYTTLLLQRILTPFGTGFVDLQSPSGAGISGVIYDYNGDVYPADEARMLARMGDKKFLMGNVLADAYREVFGGKVMKEIVRSSCVEVMPQCATCAFHIYCGADPIRNYLERKDLVGHRPSSDFCRKNMAMFRHLFSLLEEDDERVLNVFWSWVTRRPGTARLGSEPWQAC